MATTLTTCRLEADIVVTATGLNLQLLGGITLSVDGVPVNFVDTTAYKGLMLSGVPNFAYAIGYTTSSWTLKIGLLCEHFCRLLAHMDDHGHTVCYPEVSDPDTATRPLLDFSAGYVQRSIHQLPRQGDKAPWLTSMNYHDDVTVLRNDAVIDDNLRFPTSVAADMAVSRGAPDLAGAAADCGDLTTLFCAPTAGCVPVCGSHTAAARSHRSLRPSGRVGRRRPARSCGGYAGHCAGWAPSSREVQRAGARGWGAAQQRLDWSGYAEGARLVECRRRSM